jgi:hypothetical protein
LASLEATWNKARRNCNLDGPPLWGERDLKQKGKKSFTTDSTDKHGKDKQESLGSQIGKGAFLVRFVEHGDILFIQVFLANFPQGCLGLLLRFTSS